MTVASQGIAALVAAISTEVVARLALGGYTALTDGAILVGRQHVFEASAAPRIVFVPVGSKFGPKDPTAPDPTTEEGRFARAARSIATEMIQFEVHVWGRDATLVDRDYDAAQVLYQCVMQSMCKLAEGCYVVSAGRWTSGREQGTQLARSGQEFVFGLDIATPVLDELLAYAASTLTFAVHDATDVVGEPIEITTTVDHGLADGVTAIISGVDGQTQANGTFVIDVTGARTFTIPVVADGAHDYTTGGAVVVPGVATSGGVSLTDFAGHVIDHEVVE
jgi:hypothetical protein